MIGFFICLGMFVILFLCAANVNERKEREAEEARERMLRYLTGAWRETIESEQQDGGESDD